jgi:hypothetical protein
MCVYSILFFWGIFLRYFCVLFALVKLWKNVHVWLMSFFFFFAVFTRFRRSFCTCVLSNMSDKHIYLYIISVLLSTHFSSQLHYSNHHQFRLYLSVIFSPLSFVLFSPCCLFCLFFFSLFSFLCNLFLSNNDTDFSVVSFYLYFFSPLLLSFTSLTFFFFTV